MANPDAPWKCLFASSLAPFVTIDTIFLQSLYDGWAIENVLGLSCAEQFASLSECTEQEREDIQTYHKQVRDVVGSFIDQGKSVFAIACIAHDFTRGRWDNDWFEVPMNSGNMVDVATKRWLERGRVVALD